MTQKNNYGGVNYHQYKDGSRYGYGIETDYHGTYQGEYKNGSKEGYGLMKYKNGDEYDGQWHKNIKNGEGIFKEASSGKIQRILY